MTFLKQAMIRQDPEAWGKYLRKRQSALKLKDVQPVRRKGVLS